MIALMFCWLCIGLLQRGYCFFTKLLKIVDYGD
ncbi:hypothetical protein LOK49_LG02G01563 [Camellia lanceoleosa]|uniref:Uncharacterized protein n=1 Tax=Camellia lanceoleosa TaxID=1840588 RepID=A0ACC0IMD9_9ERIC|nr:hypothetical protein LOK49_LG02G01563 [Camellia lanceoleosa]